MKILFRMAPKRRQSPDANLVLADLDERADYNYLQLFEQWEHSPDVVFNGESYVERAMYDNQRYIRTIPACAYCGGFAGDAPSCPNCGAPR